MKAVRIDVDGTATELHELDLKTLQNAVGGLVDVVDSDSGESTIWVNDEGLLMGLETNFVGTYLARKLGRRVTLVGPVVLTGGVGEDGETLPISAEGLKVIDGLYITKEDEVVDSD